MAKSQQRRASSHTAATEEVTLSDLDLDDDEPKKTSRKKRKNQDEPDDYEEEEPVEDEMMEEDDAPRRPTARRNFVDRLMDQAENVGTAKKSTSSVGIITKVYVENFMCHTKLEVNLCPNVNFIHGQNGSGKSAIVRYSHARARVNLSLSHLFSWRPFKFVLVLALAAPTELAIWRP
jgi:AAA domain